MVMDISDPFSKKSQTGALNKKALLDNADNLPPIAMDSGSDFSRTQMKKWYALDIYPNSEDRLPINMQELANADVLAGFSQIELDFLSQNGFVVIPTQEDQFVDLREKVSRQGGQPYYLTTDAAFHALHLTFDELLRSLKREMLRPRLINLIQAVFDEARNELNDARGKPLEADCYLAAAYLGVALRLLDPHIELAASLGEAVNSQVAQVMAGGSGKAVLFPQIDEDFNAYQPAGYYAGDPRLETYFRGMAWLERILFKLNGPYARVPLIVTLALRRAKTVNGTLAAEEWGRIFDMLTFLVGPGDNVGPTDYASLMDRVYGKNPTLDMLADEASWDIFTKYMRELPIPHISSSFIDFSFFKEDQRGWAFMSQRITLDVFALNQLMHPKVIDRMLPDGLDIAAVWGSQPALQLLLDDGTAGQTGLSERLAWMKLAVDDQIEGQWLRSFYSGCLYSLLPQLSDKKGVYPPYMRTPAWKYKELNSALGSWVELKHETVLYTRMPETPRGAYSTTPHSGPAPGYVEPNPQVFYRLAYLTQALSQGIMGHLNQARLDSPAEGDFSASVGGVSLMIFRMGDLASHFERLGDIAAKELMGKSPSAADWQAIQTPLSMIESEVLYSQANNVKNPMEMPLIPKLVTAASYNGQSLEVGLGKVDRIFVVVPLDGKLQVAQGGVYAYRQFTCASNACPTDAEWRRMLVSGTSPKAPGWSKAFIQENGKTNDTMVFRRGDIYRVRDGHLPAVFQQASPNSPIMGTLLPGFYISLDRGPVSANGKTWWQIFVEVGDNHLDQGWVVEDQKVYQRMG